MGQIRTRAGLLIYDRNEWGARPPAKGYSPLGTIKRASFHHGGPVGGARLTKQSAILTARSFQDYQMDVREWTDMAYHFLMDGRGRLYAGRPTWALGAHTLNHNLNCIGFNFMKDGRFHALNRLELRALRILFKDGIPELNVPSLASLANHPASDRYVKVHRRFSGQSTECPGNLIEQDFNRVLKEFVR